MKKASWAIFGFLCVVIGLYPLVYVFVDRSFFIENNAGLLATKSMEILNGNLWNIGFYGHVILGGIALLIGWLQFSRSLRTKRIRLHRTIGKIYILSVLISGSCGLYIALFATGGIICILGFSALGIIWLTTTLLAFKAVKNGKITLHKKLMIFSYAACFAAVTLRIWLPILEISMGNFIDAYRIVAWLCWVPNMMFAYYLTRKREPVVGNKTIGPIGDS